MTSLGPAHQSHDYKHMYNSKDLHENKAPFMGTPNSIYGIIASNPDLTFFRRIVILAEMEHILSSDMFQGTVFVPSNTFIEEENAINSLTFDKASARAYIQYSSLPTKVFSRSLKGVPFSRIRNRNKYASFIDVKNINDTCILDDFANIVKFDIPASNGVIHIIDRILYPSSIV